MSNPAVRRMRQQRRAEFAMLLRQPGLLACIVAILIILILFCILPVVRLFLATITSQEGRLDLRNVEHIMTSTNFFTSLGHSLLLGITVAVISTLVGYVFAYAVTRTNMRGKRFFHFMAMLPILSPPFVISLAMILLFGRSGVITKTLLGIRNNNVYGFPSLMIVQTLALFPLAYLNLKGVLESIDGSVEDASRSLGASRMKVFTSVTLPLSMPGIFSALLIVFAKSISDFGNPQVLAGDFSVLSVDAYMQITGLYDLKTGAFMALSILLPALLAFFIQKYWVARKSFVTITGKPVGNIQKIRERHIVIPLFIFCFVITVIVLMLYGTVVWISLVKTWGVDMSLSLKNYQFVFKRGINAMKDTLLLAFIATPITAVLGLVISFLLVRKQFYGKKIMEVASMIPFAVPGIALGIGYILSFNTPPILLTGTAGIIVAALVFRTLSVGVEAGSNSLRAVDASIEEASAVLGANNLTTFTRISLPLMRSALFSGLLNAFVRSMTSVSAVIFLVSVNWNLLTVSIMSEIEGSRLGVASAYCVVLMVIVVIALLILEIALNGDGSRTGAKRRIRKSRPNRTGS